MIQADAGKKRAEPRIYKLTRREMEIAPSIPNSTRNLSQDSPLFEKIMRTRFDPAHAYKFARGPSATSRTYCDSSKGTYNFTTVANTPTYFLSIPSLEVPFIISLDGGVTWKGRWGDGIADAYNRVNELKAEATRTIGKSMTIRNVTINQNESKQLYSFRIDPAINVYNKCDSDWCPTAGGANSQISPQSPVAGRVVGANRKVIQNIPQSFNAITELSEQHESGCYLVNNVLDDEFRTYRSLSDMCAIANKDYPPTADQELSVLRLGFLGGVAMDGTSYVTNDNGWNAALAGNARLTSSVLQNTDICGFYIPPNNVPQTFEVVSYEHLQVMTADMDLLTKSFIDEPYDFPENDRFMRKIKMKLSGAYPAEFNSWGTIWNFIKRQASKVGDFYKEHEKILKPAISIVPGASTILDMADKFM